MKSAKPTLLLAFADDKRQPLAYLSQEKAALTQIFKDLAQEERLLVHTLSAATIEGIHKFVISHEEDLVILHYAGHADGQSLRFEDGSGYAEGFANMLAKLPRLKLVFLNGCATKDQVSYFLDNGIKAVIATHSSINDQAAFYFSKSFYEYFVQGKSLKECYEHACDFLSMRYGNNLSHYIIKRAVPWESRGLDLGQEGSPWALFYRDANALSYRGIGTELDNIYADRKLIEKLSHLSGRMPINLLIVSSSASKIAVEKLNVNNELAQIKEYVEKLFIYSNFGGKFSVNVFQLSSGHEVELILSSDDGEAKAKIQPLPPLQDMHLVVGVVWHNLGNARQEGLAPLESVYRGIFDLEEAIRPALQIYRRAEPIAVRLEDVDSSQLQRDYSALRAFFEQIDDTRIFDYHPNRFEDAFEHNLRNWLRRHLINFAPRLSRLSALPFDEGPVRNPYKGLSPYQLQDANLFFGRINEVDGLVNRLAQFDSGGLLAVMGASGSGKSSVVRAGLFKRLQLDAIPGSKAWNIIECNIIGNGQFEFSNLVGRKMAPEEFTQAFTEFIWDESKDPADLIYRYINHERNGPRTILFVDQFEEIFTLIQDSIIRSRFIEFVVCFAQEGARQVVLTMRSEFFHECLKHKSLVSMMESGQQILLPPEQESLIRIVVRPAEFSGLRLEKDLLPTIQRDIEETGGILPLVSYIMEQLFEKRRGSILTLEAYKELGGVAGIIQQQAERALSGFNLKSEDFKSDFNFLFRKLVTVRADGLVAKRPAPSMDESWPEDSRRLVRALEAKRLLVIDGQTIEIVHEALLSHWAILREWIAEVKSSLLLMAKVEQEAKDWVLRRASITGEKELIRFDRQTLWKQERLDTIYEAISLLGLSEGELAQLYPHTPSFIRPEAEHLEKELEKSFTTHQRRAEIGDRFAILSDHRSGVGLNPDGLPDIVWHEIPAGIVRLEGVDFDFKVQPFAISRYPITLMQFNAFALSDVYYNEKWWDGLPVKPREHKVYPQTPDNLANRPAEFVSWYQATAYGQWLSEALGYPVRLPDEWEWQHAASSGRPDNIYPWGESWNTEYGNNKYGVGHVVAVGLYPNGQTGQGVMDMGGNVFEWCRNAYQNVFEQGVAPDIKRVTKGGSWVAFIPPEESLKVTFRLGDNPSGKNERGDQIRAGFRLLRELK